MKTRSFDSRNGMSSESNVCSAEMEAGCSRHHLSTTIQSTPEKLKSENKRSPSPNLTSPNKRIKSGKQLVPIGIVTITSPTKSARKKTPQKNIITNYFKSPSQICISPNSRTEMCKINAQNAPKVVKNLFPKDDIEKCVMPDTPSNSEEKISCFDFPSDDDLEQCEMPDTPEKLQQMQIEMNKWRETTTSQSSDFTEVDENEENSFPSSPSILVADLVCGGFPVKDELGKQNQKMKWIQLTSPSTSKRINLQCTSENILCVDFPSDDELEQCEMPDTPEKLQAMQIEMRKWMKNTNKQRKMSGASDSTELDENEKNVWDEMDEYCQILESDSDPSKEEEPTPIELPQHVMENIFCHLPIRKLCIEANRVCKHWNEIISSNHFIPWKKCYFKLKFDDKIVHEEIAKICLDQNMAHNTLCLVGVMRYMRSFFNTTKSDLMLPAIKKHLKYSWAISLLTERMPDCIENEVPCVGSVIAALCILCSDVREILEILNCLTHHKSKCSTVDAIECLYCLATFFYYFKRNFSVNPGLHYRVYYALHHFESGSNLTGIQSSNRIQENVASFTHEQFQIINHSLGPNQVVKIVAFAGTGKTTTLVEFTKMWPNKKFLNVCFNKSVQINADKIFPRNVKSLTLHSIAYSAVGAKYKSREKLTFKLFSNKFTEFLDGDNKLVRAAVALRTIDNFVSTADELITTTHVPNGRKIKDKFVTFTIEEKIALRDDALLIWELMIDLNKSVQITHDVYLKLYQLTNPVISGYDCLLIDEAQDLNAAMTSFLFRQSYSKLIVGDPNQQVYSFRGAVDALNSIHGTHVYYLTQSFRFGPEIAYLASCTLETLKQEHKNTIVGTLTEGKFSGETKGQIAMLARSRLALFKCAATFCDQNSDLRGAFIGKLKSYNYNIIIDIFKLYQRSKGNFVYIHLPNYIPNPFIKRFSTFKLLCDFAESTNDNELLGSIMIVESYPTSIPQIIEKLYQRCDNELENADIVFSTTHKAKGHEFDTVVLTDDYIKEKIQINDGVMKCTEENDDESNILYVALTRAKHRLVISSSVVEMLLLAGERFEHFISTRDLEGKNCFKCHVSLEETMKGNFTLERRNIVLSSHLSINGGSLCFNCASKPLLYIPEYSNLWAHNSTVIDTVHCSLRQLVGPSSV